MAAFFVARKMKFGSEPLAQFLRHKERDALARLARILHSRKKWRSFRMTRNFGFACDDKN
jgi:hypothetical protein